MRATLAAIACLLVSCGAAPAPQELASPVARATADWHPSQVDAAKARRVALGASTTVREAQRAIIGSACSDAVLVWGDLVVDASAPAVAIALGDGAAVLSGFLVCEHEMEPFLRAQRDNPRLRAGHGGSADLKWRDGELLLRRKWSAGDAHLGTLAPAPEGVFQKGETLAAIFSCDDAKAKLPDVLAAIARAPGVFVFAMYPLR